jgi:hypothetical protein
MASPSKSDTVLPCLMNMEPDTRETGVSIRAMTDQTPPKPDMVSIKQVRQILFNELGLTREFVREVVRDIVEQTCQKYFTTGEFEKYLRERIDKTLRNYHYGSNELNDLITKSVGEVVRREITQKMVFNLTASFKADEVY